LASPALAAQLVGLKTPLVRLMVAAALLKAVAELLALRHARCKHYTELKRSALLLMRDLRDFMLARFALLAAGIVTALWASQHPLSIPAALSAWGLLLGGELLERTVFFAALSSPVLG